MTPFLKRIGYRDGLAAMALALCFMAANPALVALANPYGSSQPVYPQQEQSAYPPLQGRVVSVPAGTSLQTTLASSVSSETARIGDRVTVQLASPVAFNGELALPAGTQVEGQVTRVTKAGFTGRNGELEVRFNTATLPSGQRVPLSGRIETEDGSGVLRGGTNKGRVGKAALKTGGGAAAGALLGTALGPLSGGRPGKGAVYGTAVGAGIGLGAAALVKGKAVELNSGEALTLRLDQPLNLSGAGASFDNRAYPVQPSGAFYGQQSNTNYGY